MQLRKRLLQQEHPQFGPVGLRKERAAAIAGAARDEVVHPQRCPLAVGTQLHVIHAARGDACGGGGALCVGAAVGAAIGAAVGPRIEEEGMDEMGEFSQRGHRAHQPAGEPTRGAPPPPPRSTRQEVGPAATTVRR